MNGFSMTSGTVRGINRKCCFINFGTLSRKTIKIYCPTKVLNERIMPVNAEQIIFLQITFIDRLMNYVAPL